MRGPLGALLLALVASVAVRPLIGQGQQPTTAAAVPSIGPPDGWPDRHPTPVVPAEGAPRPLAKPSLTEPFAIGQALHNPGGVERGLVSVLALMGIEIVPDEPPPANRGNALLRLPESEVRALIEIGMQDAESQEQDADGPVTFRTLHALLSPALPDISVERLAEIYSEEYARHPDAVVPQVLFGQPLEPDTPLLRTELWLLLVDRLAFYAMIARVRPQRFLHGVLRTWQRLDAIAASAALQRGAA